MSMVCVPDARLSEAGIGTGLFRDWLQGGGDSLVPGLGLASGPAWPEFLGGAGSAAVECPPLLADEAWLSAWLGDQLAARSLPQDREDFQGQVDLARRGGLELIVTGQQPGFLGGPLYTLYKIATAVALAKKRSVSGRPAVAVFWSGDDDDDLAEALAPVGFDPLEGSLVRSEGWSRRNQDRALRPMVGTLPARRYSQQGAALLGRICNAGGDDLSRDLSNIWEESLRSDWNWTTLAGAAVSRVFRGQPLWVVSGRDPLLHGAAAGLYGRILRQRRELTDLARTTGRELTARGWHAQIGELSLHRPLFVRRESGRQPLAETARVTECRNLLPGVMLRSLVQDWLLRPAAVVVGPAEVAYLEQLRPLYSRLEVPRVRAWPRLFAWALPAGLEPGVVRRFLDGAAPDPAHLAGLSERVLDPLARNLEEVLARELGVAPDRSSQLARRRKERWRRSIESLLTGEKRRLAQGVQNGWPAWVAPLGRRQERTLAWIAACAWWGGSFIDTVLQAAGHHLELGGQGQWREFWIRVAEPERMG